MFLAFNASSDRAVAPATAKFTPCLKFTWAFLQGSRYGRPNAVAVKQSSTILVANTIRSIKKKKNQNTDVLQEKLGLVFPQKN